MISALAATGYASSTPKWVKAAIAAPANSYDRSVSYIVLLDEQATTVGKSGSAETRFRYVVKLLSREGRSAARREVYYDQETSLGKMRAWHLRPDGKTVKLENDQIENQSPPDELYSDSKTKLMHFPDVDAGSVVAFEWVQRARPFINQEYHYFQERSPVVVSRYRLKLPGGWRVEPFFFNHSPINPVIEGNTYTWELHALDPIKDEPLMPEMTSVAPYVAVSYFPSHGRVARKSFSSWQDVSKWASQLMDRQSEPGQAIEAKARALTADTTSTMEKIEIVSSWVQKEIRYVSIQLGAKGGYRPHPPTLVFKKGYGDCKDKAGLLQAMLRSLGVSSYPVLVYSGDPTRVRPEFPSVLQFNHAILAIATSTGSNTEGETNRVGDLVFFDPTENLTLFGDLPYYLQGSYGLVVKGDSGELVQLPEAPAAANALRRDVTMTLDKSGGIVAEVREVLSGQMAAIARRRAASAEPRDFASEIAAMVARSVPGSSVSQLEVDDDYPKASLAVGIGVKSQSFANVSGKLMIIPPALFWAGPSPDFAASERQQPVVFDMRWTQEESVMITVPEGERVDEIPSNTKLDASFGRFSQTYKIEGKQITVERRLAVTNRIVGASGYGQLKRFFDAARSASDASLVLVRSEAVASRN
jgi:transglutaminase-like putative cysteine protease